MQQVIDNLQQDLKAFQGQVQQREDQIKKQNDIMDQFQAAIGEFESVRNNDIGFQKDVSDLALL